MSSQAPHTPSAAPRTRTALRSDARDNRDRILEVARELFADRGLDVPMAAIARRAGVGAATLYRRFPTKESLITEVFADQFSACAAVVDEAVAAADPWRGFCAAVENICAMQIADRGFSAAFLATFPKAVDVTGERHRALAKFANLAERAKATGDLRADFTPDDVMLLLMANNNLTTAAPNTARAASRRLVAYLLNSFRADHADPTNPLPPPVRLEVADVLAALPTTCRT